MLDSVKERLEQYGIIADALRFIRRTDRGKPNGVASLGNDGKVLVDQLPDAALIETDPTVPAWAKDPEKPKYGPSEVGADAEGTASKVVGEHNVDTTSHNDIRLLIEGVSTKLNNFLGVDDTSATKLSELLALIEAAEESGEFAELTSKKVNIADIVANLTTSVDNQPLAASQGVILKGMIEAISSDYVKSQRIADLEARVKSLEEALGGFKLRGSTSAPFEADENTITFVDLLAGG